MGPRLNDNVISSSRAVFVTDVFTFLGILLFEWKNEAGSLVKKL